MSALNEHTKLLLVHLHAPDEVKAQRFKQRGSSQKEEFVRATATRSANLLRDMTKVGAQGLSVDTSDEDAWDYALDLAALHLWGN
jgi:ribose 1,5-bisphosphokinase PhnN